MRALARLRLLPAIVAASLLTGMAGAQIAPLLLTSLSPDSAPAGTPGLLLTVNGIGFVPGSTIYWQNVALPTSFLSGTQLRGSVSPAQLATPGTASVAVVNPGGQRSTDLFFTIRTPEFSVATDTLPAASVNSLYSATLAALGGTPPYVWRSRDPLPPGLSLSEAGVLSGTPRVAGAYALTVEVTDAQLRTASRTLTLTVAAPRLSIATESPLPPASEGAPYSQTLRADAASAPLRWSATNLPPGIAIDTATGTLSGTPTARGNYNITVQVTDATGASVSKTLALEVQGAVLTITTVSPLFNATRGTPYAYTFTATGGRTPYRWSLLGSAPGLTLDPATGALTGTPESAGTYSFTIEVVDEGNARVSKAFSITVDEPTLTITNASPLPSASEGRAYTQRFLVTGGRGPYTWSVPFGLPLGLSLNPVSGILDGTPAASGVFNFTVQVRDSGGASASKSFSVSIAAGPLQLNTATEPVRATVGQPFSSNVVAVSGGTPPLTFAANGLPDGVSIDPATGRISGTPPAPGSFPFTVRVTDAMRASATELYQLEVGAPALPSLSIPDFSATIPAADQPRVRLLLGGPYELPLAGQLLLSFTPDAGPGDPAVQFSTGGRTVDFTIPVGATAAEFPTATLGLQTGTAAGTISLQARVTSSGFPLTQTPVVVQTTRVERAAPVITSATFTRSSSGIEVRIVGYSTPREVTQATFRFNAATGQTLRTSEVTVPVEQLFSTWYASAESAAFGTQFSFRQQFTIDGDVNAVTPASVTLTNRVGSATTDIRQQ